MNEANRLLVVLVAAAWIVLMAVIIFVAWAAPEDTIRRLGDFVEFLDDNDTNAGKLIISLAALAAAVLALLVIIVELAPEDEPKELRVEQGGATTIVPADALRLRLEEALLALPDVTAARSRVGTRERGIAAGLELTVTPGANLASVTQDAVRVVIDTVQTDLGLPVSGVPTVKIAFGGSKAEVRRTGGPPPVPESPALTVPRPWEATSTPVPTSDEAGDGHADSSPGPLIFEESASPGEETEGSPDS